MILSLTVMSLITMMYMSVTVLAAFDRNEYIPSASSTPPSASSGTSTPTVDPDLLSEDELEKEKELSANSNAVDTFIYTTGILIWLADLIYVTIVMLFKVIPPVGAVIIKCVTFGKKTSVTDSMFSIILKFVIIAAVGTLFASGWIKILVAKYFGWLLTRSL